MTDLTFTTLTDSSTPATDSVSLPFDLRQRARLRVVLASGREAGLKLPRGTILRDGDVLQGSEDDRVRVVAAPETVSTVHCEDPWLLARAAYHLGNRHIWVQVGAGWLRYLHDHVLDDMVRGFGLSVTVEQAPFEPEGGAYSERGGHHHHHHHEHGHAHAQAQAHAEQHEPAADPQADRDRAAGARQSP